MDNSNSAFLEFNDMSTEELYEFLYRNTDNPDVDALQLDKITAALEVYTARVQEDLAPPCTAEEAVSAVFANISAADPVPTVPIRASRRIWRRVASVAAVVAINFTLLTIIAYAAGIPLWSAVIEWTKDTFQFVWENEITPGDPGLILQKYGVTEDGVPGWVPEGYELVEYDEPDIFEERVVTYQKDEYFIIFSARPYYKDSGPYYQQSGDPEVYESNGIRYYLFPNLKRMVAVWMEDGCECCLSGVFTKEELRNVLEVMN